jgi:protein-tyrosine phosphatase
VIDLHTHVLPGVDDGAADLDEALAMLELARQDGTVVVAATPHYLDGGRKPGRDEVVRRVEELGDAARQRGCAVEIVPGAEVHITPGLARELDGIATLNLTQYLLLELPFYDYPTFVEQVVFELLVKQVTPLIAHAERVARYQQRPADLAALVERGALAQVTGGSLLGHFGSRAQAAAELMLRAGLAHVLASDGHWTTERRPVLSSARAQAAQLVGEEAARSLVETVPQAIIRGETVAAAPPDLHAATQRRWWRPW